MSAARQGGFSDPTACVRKLGHLRFARPEGAPDMPAISRSVLPALLLLAAGVVSAQSLSLRQAQALAIERNPDVTIARAALASAQANILSAGAPPNPTLAMSTSSINLAGKGGSLWRRPMDTVVALNQLIERGGKRELRRDNAQSNAIAADEDLKDLHRQLRLLVAQAYADLHAAQDRLAAATDSARLTGDILAAAKLRLGAGDIAGTDVERVRVEALRARNERVAAEAELKRARHLVALLIADTEHADSLEAVDSWPTVEEAVVPSIANLEQIIDRRADVRAAVARIEAAGSGIKLAESLRTRDVTVGVQLEHYPQPGDPANSGGNSVGVSVQMPLFTRYYFEGEIRSSLAALDAAKANHARVRALAETGLRDALASLASAAERVRRNRDELLVAAEKSARAAEYAYRNGAVGLSDVLDARRVLRATRLDAYAAQADLGKALANWQAATETTEEKQQ